MAETFPDEGHRSTRWFPAGFLQRRPRDGTDERGCLHRGPAVSPGKLPARLCLQRLSSRARGTYPFLQSIMSCGALATRYTNIPRMFEDVLCAEIHARSSNASYEISVSDQLVDPDLVQELAVEIDRIMPAESSLWELEAYRNLAVLLRYASQNYGFGSWPPISDRCEIRSYALA